MPTPQSFVEDDAPASFVEDGVPSSFVEDAPDLTQPAVTLLPESARNLPTIADTTRGGPPITPGTASEFGETALGLVKEVGSSAMEAAALPGRIAYAGAADVLASNAEKTRQAQLRAGVIPDPIPDYGGNLKAMVTGEESPAQASIDSAARYAPGMAVAANLAKIAPELASMVAVNPSGAAGRLLALGFSADMVAHFKPMAERYAELVNLPPDEQEQYAGEIAQLRAGILTTFGFAPLAGAHGAAPLERVPVGPPKQTVVGKVLPDAFSKPAFAKSDFQTPVPVETPVTPKFSRTVLPEPKAAPEAGITQNTTPTKPVELPNPEAAKPVETPVPTPKVVEPTKAEPNPASKVIESLSTGMRGGTHVVKDFSFLEKLPITERPKDAEIIPSGPLPDGTVYLQLEAGFNGNRPPSYAITPDGSVYSYEGGFSGISPWRLEYVAKRGGEAAPKAPAPVEPPAQKSAPKSKPEQQRINPVDAHEFAQKLRDKTVSELRQLRDEHEADPHGTSDHAVEIINEVIKEKSTSLKLSFTSDGTPAPKPVAETPKLERRTTGNLSERMDYSPEHLARWIELSEQPKPKTTAEYQSPEFQKRSAEIEELKNHYNGNPPKQLSKPSEPSAKPAEATPAEIPPSPSQPAPAAGAVKDLFAERAKAMLSAELARRAEALREFVRLKNEKGEPIPTEALENAKAIYTEARKRGLTPENAEMEGLFKPEPAKLSTPETKTGALDTAKNLPQPTAADWMNRDKFMGEDFAGPPNSILIQVRGMDTKPVGDGRPIVLPFDGNLKNAGATIASGIGKAVRDAGGSFRESLIKATDENGNATHQFRYNPAEKTVAATTQAELNAKRSGLDAAISNIEALQKRIRGDGSNLKMGVPSAVLDTALEVARVALIAGKSVKEAVDAAIAHIRKNYKGEFREMEARRTLMAEMERKPTTTAPAAPAPAAAPTAAATPSRPATGTPAPPSPPAGTPPRPPAGAPAPAPAPRGATLTDIYKIFEPKPKTPFSAKRAVVNIVESLRTGLASKFRPINKLAEDIAKAYGLTRPKDIAGIFEQLKGSQGKGEADVYRFDRDVSSLVKGNEKDFNPYMFLRRTLDRLNQDAADVAAGLPARRSVSAYTIPEIQAKLNLLESNLGPEVVAKFQQAADRYQTYMDNALKLQVESGRMSQEVYDAIKDSNQFYAPFKVMKYLEQTSRPEGTGSKIDTMAEFTKAMKGIEDADFRLGDMLGAARQSILISRILADKNMAMRHVAELAPFDPSGLFIKRIPAGADAPAGMEIVNVLEAGKQKRYAVSPDVAQALQIYGGTAGGLLSRALAAMSVPFRAGATAFNLPFQVSNLLADVPRLAIMSKYGIKNPIDAIHYPLEWVHSVLASVGKDVFGIDGKLMQDFLDSGVAGGTVQEFLTPGALQFREPTSISKSRKLAESVIYSLPRFAAAIEQSTKVLGVKRAVRFEGVQGGKELAKQLPQAITELRRYSGSPDFGRQGKWTETLRLNLLYMFLNARIQGMTADVSRLAGAHGGKTTAKTWFRLASAVGIPSVYLYYLNQRPENKEDYDKRPLQEKQNYWLIPKDDENGKPRYITTEDGEKIRDYWRIPKRESAKWMANYTEAALNFAQKRDPKAALEFGNSMLQEISPVNIQGENATEKLESMASGLNPLIKAPLELATGRDLYRHRDIMSEQLKKASPELQFNDRTSEAFKVISDKMPDVAPEFLRSPIIIENLTRNLTAGLLTQFLPRKPIEGRSGAENTPLLQRFQSLPYTDQQEFKEQMTQLERNAADEQLIRHRAAAKLLEDNKDKPLEEYAAKAGDERTLKTLVDLYVAKQNGATFQDRQILSLPARQRAMYVLHALDGLKPEQKNQMILDMARKRILTEAVLDEIATQLKK